MHGSVRFHPAILTKNAEKTYLMQNANAPILSQSRGSDSPLVEMVWHAECEREGVFTSAAASHWEMVIARYHGETMLTLRGPESRASAATCPADAEFFGIVFKLGAFMPQLPTVDRLDRNDMTLPQATDRAVWLLGATWEIPTFENADTFVDRLARQGLLVQEPVVDAVLQNRPVDLSPRTVQRRFQRATGLTQGTLTQIERAQQAMALLKQGNPIADVVSLCGYADQPHLTRSLKRFMGETPGQIRGVNRLMNMDPSWCGTKVDAHSPLVAGYASG